MYVYFISQQENDYTTKNDNNKLFKKSIGLNTNSKQSNAAFKKDMNGIRCQEGESIPCQPIAHVLIIKII